jgi:hypothetical protein
MIELRYRGSDEAFEDRVRRHKESSEENDQRNAQSESARDGAAPLDTDRASHVLPIDVSVKQVDRPGGGGTAGSREPNCVIADGGLVDSALVTAKRAQHDCASQREEVRSHEQRRVVPKERGREDKERCKHPAAALMEGRTRDPKESGESGGEGHRPKQDVEPERLTVKENVRPNPEQDPGSRHAHSNSRPACHVVCLTSGRAAAFAQPDDLERVRGRDEAARRGRRRQPIVQVATSELVDPVAARADEMMVMADAAESVTALALVVRKLVDDFVLREQGQGSVHGGQAHRLLAAS